jgi:hypothetical protein
VRAFSSGTNTETLSQSFPFHRLSFRCFSYFCDQVVELYLPHGCHALKSVEVLRRGQLREHVAHSFCLECRHSRSQHERLLLWEATTSATQSERTGCSVLFTIHNSILQLEPSHHEKRQR